MDSPPLFIGRRQEQPSSYNEPGGSPVFIGPMDSPQHRRNGNVPSNFSSPFSKISSPYSINSSPFSMITNTEVTQEDDVDSQASSFVPTRIIPRLHRPSSRMDTVISGSDSDSDTSYTDYGSLHTDSNAFHTLFPGISQSEHLFEVYECALVLWPEVLSGKLYISEKHLSFSKHFLGQVTTLMIPLCNVISVEKGTASPTSMPLPISNPVHIHTSPFDIQHKPYTFAFFLSPAVYYVIYNAWQSAHPCPSVIPTWPPNDNHESFIVDNIIPGTPNMIYNLMFTGGFLKDFLAGDLRLKDVQVSNWHPIPTQSDILERDITYTRPPIIGHDLRWFRYGATTLEQKICLKQKTHLVDFKTYTSVLTTYSSHTLYSSETLFKTRTYIMRAGVATSRLIIATLDSEGVSGMALAIDREQRDCLNLERAIRSYIAAHPLEFTPHEPVVGHSHESIVMRLTNQGVLEIVPTDVPQSPRDMAFVMYEFLVHHGCPDLMSLIDPLAFSSSAVAEGGFGDIWIGRSHGDQMKLAIKVLRFASLTSDTAKKDLKRITREIYNWSKLDHENVNKLMGVIMFRERLGMVSEWMEHGNLRQYLNRNASVDRRQLCTQIARGAAYLYSVNMVHGDLKACNILVSSTGILKITDFDYSIFPECSLAFSATSRMGGGTLRWMAPELLLDEEPQQRNLKTDIYALGMTFLETITNAHPYSECQLDHQIYRKLLCREHPKRSEEHFPDTEWGNGMWNLLLECWDFSPASRPTADAILSLLLTLESGTADTT
ncbi:unnamed protein product [Rhizoctonia solani]|uniref:Protein kinase domain-containing protein n=1 Tax=Rhizoctonia solani TaxID=456999 RepID=A0A8H3CGR6_9AGAM|nr:unnamed protein product [Rhizoctonia solani]